jgi:hypothetical protein
MNIHNQNSIKMPNQEYDNVKDYKAAYIQLSKDLEEYLEGDFFQNAMSKNYADTISYDIALLMEKSMRQEFCKTKSREDWRDWMNQLKDKNKRTRLELENEAIALVSSLHISCKWLPDDYTENILLNSDWYVTFFKWWYENRIEFVIQDKNGIDLSEVVDSLFFYTDEYLERVICFYEMFHSHSLDRLALIVYEILFKEDAVLFVDNCHHAELSTYLIDKILKQSTNN